MNRYVVTFYFWAGLNISTTVVFLGEYKLIAKWAVGRGNSTKMGKKMNHYFK